MSDSVGGGLRAAAGAGGHTRDGPSVVRLMEENRARRVVQGLRAHGVDAALKKVSVYQFGVAVTLRDGREAVWDADGTAGLEATVMADGMLRGFVPQIEGSETWTEEQVVNEIWHTDYDKPVGRRRESAPPKAAPLPPQGGVFARFLDGFRYR